MKTSSYRTMVPSQWLIAACLSVLAIVNLSAQNTALSVDTDGRPSVYFSSADANFSATQNGNNSVHISVTNNGNFYYLDFAAPGNAPLSVGVYENAVRYPFQGSNQAGLSFVGNGAGCNTVTGRFEVKQAIYGAGNAVVAFHATFTQYCEGQPPAAVGEILYNSSDPVPPRNHISSGLTAFGTKGQPFQYQIRGSNNPTSFSASGLPAGLSLNTSTGLVSGTPTSEGNFTVSISATGGGGMAFGTLSLTIDPAGQSRGEFSALYMKSDAGDYIGQGQTNVYRESDGSFSASSYSANSVSISFRAPNYSTYWTLSFSAPSGQALGVGFYENATRSASASAPGLDVFGSGRGCNSTSGEFEIKEINILNNVVVSFRASFIQHCESSSAPALHGEIWYHTGVAITSDPYFAAIRGNSFSYQIVANNLPNSYTASGLPPGVSLDPATGILSGVPSLSGTFSILLNAIGNASTASGRFTLVVAPHAGDPAPPAITSPTTALAVIGQSFNYQITATNNPTLFSATGLPAGLMLDSATGIISGAPSVAGNFDIILKATSGSASGGGSLTLVVNPLPPVITSDASAFAIQGRPFTFQVVASNNPTSFTAVGLPAGLTINSAGLIAGTTNQTGSFSVSLTAKNSGGSGFQNFTVTVNPPRPQLGNISTRLKVGIGDDVLIGGFIIDGVGDKKVIIRAIGPSISINGAPLAGTLQDPVLELFDAGGNSLKLNDNWKDTQEQEIRDTTIPPTDDRESALVMQLPPGSYTAIVKGKQNTTGIAVVEAYDLNTAANSKLANIASRGLVPSNDVMIGGVIVSGNGNQRVIVRAIGQSLTDFGINNALPDTTLELFDSNGNSMAFNDNWADTQATDIQNTGLAPKGDHESAILATLPNGGYTNVVRGKNGQSGIAVVEVYALP